MIYHIFGGIDGRSRRAGRLYMRGGRVRRGRSDEAGQTPVEG